MNTDNLVPARGWTSAWFDAAAFAGGLALAWFGRWETKDLVWSLWLSSLLVGYAMIVWMIFSPGLLIAWHAWRDREVVSATPMGKKVGLAVLYLAGALFMLAFFTVHFGGFHFGHSVFLNVFFPMEPGTTTRMPGLALYRAVFAAYWPFVIVAAVAEREAFLRPVVKKAVPDTSVTPEAIGARKARKAAQGGTNGMMTPYKNVIRLHLLIFFFAFASFAKINSFAVYAVVYAVYFFPWRLLRRAKVQRAESTG